MKVYKLKHLPTGLYYSPVKGRYSSDKTNLNKVGKLYSSKSYIKLHSEIWVSSSQRVKFPDLYYTRDISLRNTNRLKVHHREWKIEEYELKLAQDV